MHIALYSYKVADRKQMERLMEREADRWIKDGNPLYIFTFGSIESLYASTLIYDAVMIDLCEIDNVTPIEIATKYKNEGFNTRVIECVEPEENTADVKGGNASSERNYSEDILSINKPLRPADIHELMVELDKLKKSFASKIEIRTDTETVYIEEPDILYAVQNGHKMEITLKDGRVLSSHGRVQVLYDEIESVNPTIILPAPNTIVNIRHISRLFINKAHMSDGRSFIIGIKVISYVKKAMALLADGSDEAIKELELMNQLHT